MKKYSKVIMTETGRELLLSEADQYGTEYGSDILNWYVWDDLYVLDISPEGGITFMKLDIEEDSEPITATTCPFSLYDEDGNEVHHDDLVVGIWL